jgi:hypothetical protein
MRTAVDIRPMSAEPSLRRFVSACSSPVATGCVMRCSLRAACNAPLGSGVTASRRGCAVGQRAALGFTCADRWRRPSSRALLDSEGSRLEQLDGGCGRRHEGGLEAEGGARREIVVAGGIRLVRTLMDNDLVDELRLMIHPAVLGAGERLFGETSDQRPVRRRDPDRRRPSPTSPTRSSERPRELLRHIEADGKIALIAVESREYERLMKDSRLEGSPKLVKALACSIADRRRRCRSRVPRSFGRSSPASRARV